MQNHTQHITKVKKTLADTASKKELREFIQESKKFACNSELRDLYDKVVPPVAYAQDVAADMKAEVARFQKIIEQYDENLSVKANKQELLAVDNKFRLFVKKDKYKPFVETTELDHHELKTEVNEISEILKKLEKNLPNDIHLSVRKATAHLKQTPVDEGKNLEAMLLQAHLEQE